MTEGVLFQALVYLAAAVICVPIAKRLGLGAVLGYLIAGVADRPVGLRLIGGEGEHVMHFAEFGVVMMLFLVGLELEPRMLWRMRKPIFGLGGLQVVVADAGDRRARRWRSGSPGSPRSRIGLILAMSSHGDRAAIASRRRA